MTGYNVLVVEDSPTMRQLMVFALKPIRGFQIVEANDGVDGLKKLSAQKFDLIVTDINMPIMDGLKLVKRIRSDETHKDVPIIIITTEGSTEDRQRAMALACPGERAAWAFDNQFFFGDDLLVAPCIRPGGSLQVYLPSGRWHRFPAGGEFTGGRVYEFELALHETAVFAREGATIPLAS